MAAVLAHNPGSPLVTFYDHATGERTELSGTTYANWVAKTASYLVEECDLERGHCVQIDLPTHWLGTVFLGACWTVGLSVVDADADAAVTGPDGVERWAPIAGPRPVVACALKPFAGPFTEDLPPGLRDFGREVWSQPDSFMPWDPPTPEDLATDTLSQSALFGEQAAAHQLQSGARVLSVANPATEGLVTFAAVLASRGSLVLVANPDDARLAATYATERATTRV